MNSRQWAASVRELLRPRPWTAALVDAVLVLACLASTALAVKTPWSSTPWPVIAGAGLLGSLAVPFRWRQPMGATVVAAGAMGFSGNPLPLVMTLFYGAVGVPRRSYPVLALVGVTGFVLSDWVNYGKLNVATVTAGVGATVLDMSVGIFVTTRRQLVASLREQSVRVEAERALLDEQARAGERNRIAREMHDVMAHKIALISLHAGGLEVNPAAGPDRVEQAASLIRTTAGEALDELRAVLGVLRGGSLDGSVDSGETEPEGRQGGGGEEQDSFADLRGLVDRWTEASAGLVGTGGARARVTLRDEAGRLPPVMARTVYRLVQEGLTNVHRHAPGAPVTIEVTSVPESEVWVSVVNSSSRSPTLANSEAGETGTISGGRVGSGGAGVGLVGLAERFRLMGGTVSSGPDKPGGWRLEGRLPWTPPSQDVLRPDEDSPPRPDADAQYPFTKASEGSLR